MTPSGVSRPLLTGIFAHVNERGVGKITSRCRATTHSQFSRCRIGAVIMEIDGGAGLPTAVVVGFVSWFRFACVTEAQGKAREHVFVTLTGRRMFRVSAALLLCVDGRVLPLRRRTTGPKHTKRDTIIIVVGSFPGGIRKTARRLQGCHAFTACQLHCRPNGDGQTRGQEKSRGHSICLKGKDALDRRATCVTKSSTTGVMCSMYLDRWWLEGYCRIRRSVQRPQNSPHLDRST
ncbi:hypothetical protein B0J11DRAFT_95034 [Dendryphion nanum]|uniref:Uncharacterized protein n=1 Tax=Dendryphion nanum TaxID=256645 RepID=A0A9P9DET8_9PLEO|nr:hypothetical protein B0J11DRAFT_95034 [Dendryphion nanum]